MCQVAADFEPEKVDTPSFFFFNSHRNGLYVRYKTICRGFFLFTIKRLYYSKNQNL